MTQYWDQRFIRHLDKDVKTIFEVGARYGDESIELSKHFPDAHIYSFECNPLTIETCFNKLKYHTQSITFMPFGLGDKNEERPFYSYIDNNDGASSFLKRLDFESSQIESGILKIRKLSDVVKEYNIPRIDLLCMDVQGYEVNVLKGSEDFIKNIRYVIIEEPSPIINTEYLPEGVYSKYIGSPSSQEINKFMTDKGFVVIERLQENKIEDNVMYKRIK